MTPEQEFDRDAYLEVNRARDAVFDMILKPLVATLGLQTAVDVGCGTGYYSRYLSTLGLQVKGFDARVDNIRAAQYLNPEIDFAVADIENLPDGTFDLVFCTGLLYHLENPFRAMRNLRALCKSVCVIESRVHWGNLPSALLIRDREGYSQALRNQAMLLSRPAMISLLYASGFEYVYSIRHSSKHPELKTGFMRKPRRAFFVASTVPLNLTLEPKSYLLGADYYYKNSLARFWASLLESFRWLFIR